MAATLTQAHPDRSIIESPISWSWLDKAGECFWFSLCLLLFVILGPFSAPIVLGYIFFGKLGDQAPAEPDPVTQQFR